MNSSNNDLRCPICEKFSNNNKSHGRHIRYCRKKASVPARTRKRSCLACIKAKTHCDAAVATPCSRCTLKHLPCRLELRKPSRPQIVAPEGDATASSSGYLIKVKGKCFNFDMHTAHCEPLLADWQRSYPSNVNTEDDIILVPSPPEAQAVRCRILHSNPQQEFDAVTSTIVPDFRPAWPSLSLQSMNQPSLFIDNLGPQLTLIPPRAFSPKLASGKTSLTSRYMLATVRKYPQMMLSNTELPPFISSRCSARSHCADSSRSPGPIARCSGIMSLWTTKNWNNAHYIWKIIRIEQERLAEEISKYDDMMAVNALQAITIYILLRISCPDEDNASFDIPLIQTMSKLATRAGGITAKYCDPTSSTVPSYTAWTVVESLRRTITTVFIIESLFDISAGMGGRSCDSLKYWSEMLVPSSRALWEAQTEDEWRRVYKASFNDQRPWYGELLRYDQLSAMRRSLLDRWMSEVDAFGTLVINSATISDILL